MPAPVPAPAAPAGQTPPAPAATQGQTQPAGAQPAGLAVPPEVLAKFGDLITLIKGSESMNDEERQYWINILPVMTAEQIQNLRDILDNEKKQLAAIDAKYQTELDKMGDKETIRQTEEERKKRRLQRSSTEATHKEKEDAAADNILKQIEGAAQA